MLVQIIKARFGILIEGLSTNKVISSSVYGRSRVCALKTKKLTPRLDATGTFQLRLLLSGRASLTPRIQYRLPRDIRHRYRRYRPGYLHHPGAAAATATTATPGLQLATLSMMPLIQIRFYIRSQISIIIHQDHASVPRLWMRTGAFACTAAYKLVTYSHHRR